MSESEPSVSPADTIRLMLEGGDFCSYCARPVATEQDWDEFPEGGGEHLCWDGGDAGCTDAGAITLRRDDVVALLAVGERDKAEIAALKGCPAGEGCAINSGAVHCFHCRRNWPRDETWEQPFLDRPDLRHQKIETMHGLLDTVEAERERDRRQIAQLTEALDEARETLWEFDKEPVLAPSFSIEDWKHRLFVLRVKLDSLATARAVLAGEEDADG